MGGIGETKALRDIFRGIGTRQQTEGRMVDAAALCVIDQCHSGGFTEKAPQVILGHAGGRFQFLEPKTLSRQHGPLNEIERNADFITQHDPVATAHVAVEFLPQKQQQLQQGHPGDWLVVAVRLEQLMQEFQFPLDQIHPTFTQAENKKGGFRRVLNPGLGKKETEQVGRINDRRVIAGKPFREEPQTFQFYLDWIFDGMAVPRMADDDPAAAQGLIPAIDLVQQGPFFDKEDLRVVPRGKFVVFCKSELRMSNGPPARVDNLVLGCAFLENPHFSVAYHTQGVRVSN